ncbi:MAG: tetratricopeptide repeat protein [bacterium]|nr:tetratricopeptide repeat protein [bacterium]
MLKKALIAALLTLWGVSTVPSQAAPRFKSREFQTQYRQILGVYAEGDLENALDALAELESTTVGEDAGAGVFEQLLRAKLRVVRDLLKSGPEVLVPIARFQLQAYLSYRRRGVLRMAGHSRVMVTGLMNNYAERVEQDDGKLIAAGLLTSLAGYLHQAAMEPPAVGLYLRAIELDPTHEAALLGLAAAHEKRGNYEEALRFLRRLGESHGDNAEGRLRLGINLYRAGERPEAASILRTLVAGEAPDWVLSLAYQELGRRLLEDGELNSARSLLQQGMVRLPWDPVLPIQLAHLADRARVSAPRFDLAQTLRNCAQNCYVSPRYLYTQTPRGALDELRETLRASVEPQRRLLARALSLTTATKRDS